MGDDWRGIPEEYRNAIVTGDAQVLAERVPDESVDLIFTDPVYQNITDYRWLAKTAVRVLKPTGVLLCWSNGKWHHANTNWLEQAGLIYRYDFGCVINTGPAPMCGKIIAKTNRVIWLDKSGVSSMVGYLADGYLSNTWSDLFSEWNWTKNPIYTQQAIRAFVELGGIVLDPFAGQGTIPAACKASDMNYIAFEIDPDTAELARRRVQNTQPPLPGINEMLQPTLFEEEDE